MSGLLSILKPGDSILYKASSVFGVAINVKTWSWVSHIETYIGEGKSVASRDGVGVGRYDLRLDHIYAIRRPNRDFHLDKALAWFIGVAGQGYDWLGLLRFTWRTPYIPDRLHPNKMFCSEFTARFYRRGDFDPFPGADADAVPPGWFEFSPVFDAVALPVV